MCDYCDFDNENGVKFLYEDTTSSGILLNGACLIKPTPISIRKHPKRRGTLQCNEICIPIAYCPICGRKL